ncbi:hypothetical protein NLG97_g9569 [Lecanicillium saksenae]|uniref:Uncharacterized protein n=1 Tax=Lecanicillium saksenae TaxID=468837 RepID=A0ACC1QIY4_9HYPO|nr:hypothetical protein NLG97_g9569 [Lecanicillium saksenae]
MDETQRRFAGGQTWTVGRVDPDPPAGPGGLRESLTSKLRATRQRSGKKPQIPRKEAGGGPLFPTAPSFGHLQIWHRLQYISIIVLLFHTLCHACLVVLAVVRAIVPRQPQRRRPERDDAQRRDAHARREARRVPWSLERDEDVGRDKVGAVADA